MWRRDILDGVIKKGISNYHLNRGNNKENRQAVKSQRYYLT